MMNHRLPGYMHLVLTAGLVLISSGWATASANKVVEKLGADLMDALDVDSAKCLPEHVAWANYSIMLCGSLPRERFKDLKTLRKTIDDFVSLDPSTKFGDWRREGNLHSTLGAVDRYPVLIILDRRKRLIVFQYPTPTDGPCLAFELDEPEADDTITHPRLIEDEYRTPEYPELARVARVNGLVFLQAVVRSDGSVGEICVQGVNRPNLGFDEAAIESVKQWRYEPATRNGQPIDVPFTLIIEFKLHDPR